MLLQITEIHIQLVFQLPGVFPELPDLRIQRLHASRGFSESCHISFLIVFVRFLLGPLYNTLNDRLYKKNPPEQGYQDKSDQDNQGYHAESLDKAVKPVGEPEGYHHPPK